ncbi:MAG: N-acetylmuramoyl-L-alanine amidase CwlB [Candidatus Roizmanbacteria bacterium GW2011_GWC2_37_13]|uniref:N-acetylmuramoyl-L-alanine amidase CwlB n=1 Tax=Candidatus Roizmanbacteria bacterium GW2011_GWC2_37_13 TaxID=1618486 RepID=A0A0G0G641_9BACT|nr:MAG: N-acetylmuramoyl-L-alanine amidase CwlB [Candidatus Roizmanbacteria bacterium GW2011_GWC1_37_12]KKQ25522.1 MAG: N-acetylmuramoyl-L-alanine amidase CwlB [Candidatus Roizmanbacteria bacterium GW2011_GWC2_37_13]
MKNYFFTIVLILLVVFGLFNIFNKNKANINQRGWIANVSITEQSEEESVEQGLTLELTSPKDKTTINVSTVIVSGKTSPGVDVFINEKELKADSSGNFSINYELFEGENNIFVAANDIFGNYAERSVTVYLETTE